MRQLLSAVLLLAATLAVGCSAQETGVSGGDTQEPEEVQLRILAINDFHGNIATTSDAFGGVGRADYLAANIAAARAGAENSVFVSAGDLIGGSPLISALFHDEPTIHAMNLMGLDLNGVGNHEFDEGPLELSRMQQGGLHPEADDMDGEPFQGADFQFLAANVIDDETGSTIFPSYAVRDFQGIKVAFIGLTLEGTPLIVARSGVTGLSFLDEADTVNSLVPRLQEEGIQAIVVLLHQGGFSEGGQNDCGAGLDGPVTEVTERLDQAVDLVIAGHTHDEFVCEIGGKWVTMADNAGRLFTVIAYAVRDFQGIKVAFIGLTLEGTPLIVARSGVTGLSFLDEADTVNSLVPRLQEEGIQAIVVLLHQGGFSEGGQNDCGAGLDGPVTEVTERLDQAVDLVIAGHTHDEFVCEIGGKWVTMADNAGRLFTVIDATLRRSTGDLTVQTARNLPNSQAGITPVPALTALIDRYDRLSSPRANAVVGVVTADITRQQNEAGESALGDVIADAHLAATKGADDGNAVVAFMNPGGIRDNIQFAKSGTEADGELAYGEAFAVNPFGNSLVTMTLTGAQIDALLEQQFNDGDTGYGNVLQVSAGFSYTWDAAAPVGSRVNASSIAIDGVAIEPDGRYRVAVNSFLADGGSGFSVLEEGTLRTGGEIDVDAFVAYFARAGAVAPGAQDRITRVN